MPEKSKAQVRKMFVLEKEGKLPPGKAEEMARSTPNIKKLPEHVKSSLNGVPRHPDAIKRSKGR
jgi:hypothetical protein